MPKVCGCCRATASQLRPGLAEFATVQVIKRPMQLSRQHIANYGNDGISNRNLNGLGSRNLLCSSASRNVTLETLLQCDIGWGVSESGYSYFIDPTQGILVVQAPAQSTFSNKWAQWRSAFLLPSTAIQQERASP